MFRIRIRILIHGSAFRNCGSGSRLIYEQISYTHCKLKTVNFFYSSFERNISGRRPNKILARLRPEPGLNVFYSIVVVFNRIFLLFSTQNYLLLAIFLYLRIWIRNTIQGQLNPFNDLNLIRHNTRVGPDLVFLAGCRMSDAYQIRPDIRPDNPAK